MNSTRFLALSRSLSRPTRIQRWRIPGPRKGQQIRSQQTTASPPSPASGGLSPAILGGLIGGGVTFAAGYAWYHFSGAKTLVNTAHSAKAYLESAKNQVASAVKPDNPSETLKWLRSTSTAYVAVIPGAKQYVDKAFDDLDTLYDKHSDKVDAIVKNAYGEIQGVVKDKGMTTEAAQEVYSIVQKYSKQVQDLAASAASDLLDNHPELKDKIGGNLDMLKSMGENYGSEAKRQVDDTINKVKEIASNGLNSESFEKIQKLVQEKVAQIQKMGDQAWEKGMGEAQKYLDKAPEVKKMINENVDKLKQGNAAELFSQVKKSVESGNTDDLKAYIKEATDKADKASGGKLSDMSKMIPAGIGSSFTKLQELAEKHGKEAQQIAKDTFEEVQQVLKKNLEKAQKLADKTKDDAKKS